jgi:Protein of unknown function (DUF998)
MFDVTVTESPANPANHLGEDLTMTTHTAPRTASTTAPAPTCDKATGVTKSLLGYGVIAGPLYFVVGLAQAATRDGFDLGRHPFSLLSNGPLGWIQIANFVLTGLMTIACALGVRRVLRRRPGGVWGPRLIGVYGTGLVSAGVFRADPADGFPRGTPAGIGDVSWHGVLHMASFGVGFLCLIAACFVVARGLAALGQRRSATYSRIGGYVILASVAASFATAGSTTALVALYLAVVVAWSWLAVTAARLYHEASPATAS